MGLFSLPLRLCSQRKSPETNLSNKVDEQIDFAFQTARPFKAYVQSTVSRDKERPLVDLSSSFSSEQPS